MICIQMTERSKAVNGKSNILVSAHINKLYKKEKEKKEKKEKKKTFNKQHWPSCVKIFSKPRELVKDKMYKERDVCTCVLIYL